VGGKEEEREAKKRREGLRGEGRKRMEKKVRGRGNGKREITKGEKEGGDKKDGGKRC
jgi:hypothetical protein